MRVMIFRGMTRLVFCLCLFTVFSGCSVMHYMRSHEGLALEGDGVVERPPIYYQGDWIIARSSMHNHTNLSDGCRTPEDLLELARRQGMAILAYTDHREGDICYKPNICLPINGVEKIGYEAYFERLRAIKDQSEDMIVIIGVEVMPYFYNLGKPPNFLVMNQNYHFTVYDIHDPDVLRGMPARRDIETLKPEQLVGPARYQRFVDYIVDHGGIVHAVHVESDQDMWVGPAHFVSEAHPHYIRVMNNLTGFSVLPSAMSNLAGGAGGAWDAALLEYLSGSRDCALWTMADADYHGPEGSPAWATTFYYMREFTEAEVYRCLREGRMVAQMGESFQDVYVSEFSVSEGGRPDDAIMLGRSITVSRAPVIRFSLSREVPDVHARLVRNGKVIYEADACSFTYTDREIFEKNIPAFYRVEMTGPRVEPPQADAPNPLNPESRLFTNPVFVYMD